LGVSAAADGFHHPATEDELVDIVKLAYREGRSVRVRGAAHSIAHAIYADPLSALSNRVNVQSPPAGDNVNVMLNRYRGWRVKDEARKLVEADAGIHLGANPTDPTGSATLEASLLGQLASQRGWTLFDTGGITHQTVSGFTASGSSGGSLRFAADQNLHGFRVIDGTGAIHDLSRDDADPDPFYAMSPNLGLLGVVSTITFECTDVFAIKGEEATTTTTDCPVDMFGDGSGDRPGLAQFLRDTDFARLEWWPQRGVDRVVTWQAQRFEPGPGFRPSPYQRFGDSPEASQQLIAILFTILGNLDHLARVKPKLEDSFDELHGVLEQLRARGHLGTVGKALADFLSHAIEFGVDAAFTVLKPLAPMIKRGVPDFFPELVRLFIALDADKPGAQKGQPQRFIDWGWTGLPMDNGVDDDLLATEFTEAWVPLPRTQQVMQLLHHYFASPRDAHDAYARTGTYAWELYSAMPATFWLSPGYTSGSDEWQHGALRIDPYWFADNAADPSETLFAGLWQLLRDNEIPFRLHWGKFQPIDARGERDWSDFFAAQYPRWDDFLALRRERDPNNIFLNAYWRDRFGLWEEPAPAPIGARDRRREQSARH
jgi:D-arabinono-1,4-lactone oxidase